MAVWAAKRVLKKAGLSDDEVEGLFRIVEHELLEGRFAAQDQRVQRLETWQRLQHATRPPSRLAIFAQQVAISVLVDLIVRIVIPILISSYDDILSVSHRIISDIEANGKHDLGSTEKFQVQILRDFALDKAKLDASSSVGFFVAPALEYFGYLCHGEFLYRKAIEEISNTMGKGHVHMGVTRAPLIRNLYKQGRQNEASREYKKATHLILVGHGYAGENYDYGVRALQFLLSSNYQGRAHDLLGCLLTRMSRTLVCRS